MGGFGSGQKLGSKGTTSGRVALDIRWIQRQGYLISGHSSNLNWTRNGEEIASIQFRAESDHAVLNYRTRRNGGELAQMNYSVPIEWTPCNYGGQRAWFLCPAQGCGRRVAILFGGSVFACRSCYDLAYACQRESGYDRAIRRADAIRSRLGWKTGIANPIGDKPKGMHWRTYYRLLTEYSAFTHTSVVGIALLLGRMRSGA